MRTYLLPALMMIVTASWNPSPAYPVLILIALWLGIAAFQSNASWSDTRKRGTAIGGAVAATWLFYFAIPWMHSESAARLNAILADGIRRGNESIKAELPTLIAAALTQDRAGKTQTAATRVQDRDSENAKITTRTDVARNTTHDTTKPETTRTDSSAHTTAPPPTYTADRNTKIDTAQNQREQTVSAQALPTTDPTSLDAIIAATKPFKWANPLSLMHDTTTPSAAFAGLTPGMIPSGTFSLPRYEPPAFPVTPTGDIDITKYDPTKSLTRGTLTNLLDTTAIDITKTAFTLPSTIEGIKSPLSTTNHIGTYNPAAFGIDANAINKLPTYDLTKPGLAGGLNVIGAYEATGSVPSITGRTWTSGSVTDFTKPTPGVLTGIGTVTGVTGRPWTSGGVGYDGDRFGLTPSWKTNTDAATPEPPNTKK